MSNQHTPGPWRIGTPGPNGCYTVGTEQGLMVAHVAHSANHLAQCEQAIGDARLIAAAPDLLEALCKLAQLYDAMDVPRGPCRIMADAAIAKATGGAA